MCPLFLCLMLIGGIYILSGSSQDLGKKALYRDACNALSP
jgi:hypothetical protein